MSLIAQINTSVNALSILHFKISIIFLANQTSNQHCKSSRDLPDRQLSTETDTQYRILIRMKKRKRRLTTESSGAIYDQ